MDTKLGNFNKKHVEISLTTYCQYRAQINWEVHFSSKYGSEISHEKCVHTKI